MKIAIIGPNVEDISFAKLIIQQMEAQGIDLSTIKEAYIEVDDNIQKEDMVFKLENIGQEYIERLAAIDRFTKTKDRSYSTKFKDTGVNHGKNYKSRGKM
jgi:hypothetical protein